MQTDSQVHVHEEENRDSKMSMTICMRSKSLIRMSLIQTHFTRCYLQNDKYFLKYDKQKGGIEMKVEQIKDDNILVEFSS